MKRLPLPDPWLREVLPRGWPVGTSAVVTGAGRSGKAVVGHALAGRWLEAGGSVLFLSLPYPDHRFIAEGLLQVADVDVARHVGRVVFVELDPRMEGMEEVSSELIRANLTKPEVWDEAVEAAASRLPGDGPGTLFVASALNLLLFSPTYARPLLERMKRALRRDAPSSCGTVLFTVGNSAKTEEIAELEELADNLLIAHTRRTPFRLFVRVARMKGVRFRPDPVEVPLLPGHVERVDEVARYSRSRLLPAIADL